jgi:hypothetical protein
MKYEAHRVCDIPDNAAARHSVVSDGIISIAYEFPAAV